MRNKSKYILTLLLIIILNIQNVLAQSKQKLFILFNNSRNKSETYVNSVKTPCFTFEINDSIPMSFYEVKKISERVLESEYAKLKKSALLPDKMRKITFDDFEELSNEKYIYVIDITDSKNKKLILVERILRILP